MDIFTRDLEYFDREMNVGDVRHAEMLRDMLGERDFTEQTDASNVAYAFEMAKWVAEHFEYLTYASSEEMEGECLPSSLKSVILHVWQPKGEVHTIYPAGSKISLEFEAEPVPLAEPTVLQTIIQDVLTEGKAFKEVLEDTQSILELDQDIVAEHQSAMSERVIDETVTIRWTHPMSHSNGLTITIKPESVTVLPFATSEYAQRLYDFCTSENQRLSSLAHITSELVVLAAEHCMPRQAMYFTDKIEIDTFSQHLREL